MHSGPLSIIVIEDDGAHMEAIRRSLITADSSTIIRHATSLAGFHDLIKKDATPDIALVDFNLADGRALDILKNPVENQPFPILIMTSQGDEHSAVEALKSGAIDYVVKSPESFAGFPRTIERALREWHLLKAHKIWVEALRDSELRFRTLVECVPIGIYLTNASGDCTYVNRKWTEMAGMEAQQALGKGWTLAIHPADRERVGEKWYQALSSEGRWGFEYRLLTPAQKISWVFGTAAPIRDENGQIKGYVGSNVDITERKKAEESRLDLERRFLHAQKMESLGILAGGIAHDFNNLLMAILGNLELIQDEFPTETPARVGITKAMHAAHQAANLTRQMLAYSGHSRFMFAGLNLNSIIGENIPIFKSAVARQITFNIQLSPDLPPILADAGQLQQIIMNLVINASEAIGDRAGQINLVTRLQSCDADLLAASRLDDKPSPGRFVCLEVSDTGSGMNGEVLRRLFDPFFTTKATGRGLGMSSVLGIVRAHKGAILVDSQVGNGSLFRVFFPAAEAAPALEKTGAVMPISPATTAQPHSGRVLIVDDEEMVRSVCEKMVQRFGFQTVAAVDGYQAVEIFRQQLGQFDGVLLDLTMPGMDGVATLKALREIQPDIKILLASGYSEQEVLDRFDGQGVTGVIQKPFQMAGLQRELGKFGNPVAA